MTTFTITSRSYSHITEDYQDAQRWAWSLAEADAMLFAGTPNNWQARAKLEWTHNDDGNVTGVRILAKPQGKLAAYIQATEEIGRVVIDTDWAVVEANAQAEARRLQEEVVRGWIAAGIPVPADYPVQPSDLEAMPVKETTYDIETHDFRATLDGELVGYYRNYSDAEQALDAQVYARLTHQRAAA